MTIHQKLTGISFALVLAVGVTTVAATAKDNFLNVNAGLSVNETVDIFCPFGIEDGTKYLTLSNNNGTPELNVSNTPVDLKMSFNYSTGSFKIYLDDNFVNFNKMTMSATGGSDLVYADGICSANISQGVKLYLAIHNDIASYSKTEDHDTYKPIIPFYSANQYIGWCTNCTAHQEYYVNAQQYLYNIVYNKNNIAAEYRPQEVQKFVLTGNNFPASDSPTATSGYGKYNGTRTIDGEWIIQSTDVMPNSGELQFKKSTGTLTISRTDNKDFTIIVSNGSLTVNNKTISNSLSNAQKTIITLTVI